MDIKYKVVEIFDSIDGEGIRTGIPVSFIRLAGCNLRCSYCDTLYALFGEKEPCMYKEMTAEEIFDSLNTLFKRVTLTGGEPLAAAGAGKLIEGLAERGYEVNIETNGAADISGIAENTSLRRSVFFTIDYKLPSSGMCDRMLWDNFLMLDKKDVIKFVVGSDEDVSVMLKVVEELKKNYTEMPHIFIGAVYEKFSLKKLADLVMTRRELADARIQIQLHKLIWDPDARGV